VPERASQLVPYKEAEEEDEREEEDTLKEVSNADPFKLPF
jgi:hypothetical protein